MSKNYVVKYTELNLSLEMGTLKSIILIKIFHIQALTLVNDLGPSETLQMLRHLVL